MVAWKNLKALDPRFCRPAQPAWSLRFRRVQTPPRSLHVSTHVKAIGRRLQSLPQSECLSVCRTCLLFWWGLVDDQPIEPKLMHRFQKLAKIHRLADVGVGAKFITLN